MTQFEVAEAPGIIVQRTESILRIGFVRNIVLTKLAAFGVARYITHQRDRFSNVAVPLDGERRALMRRHFSEVDLDRLRILENTPLPLPRLAGSNTLRRITRWQIPEPGLVAAITFDHLVMAQNALDPAVLFHELVHVVQYRLLGVPKFAFEYARGFLETWSYERIPMEACAYELEDRFRQGEPHIDVEAEIRRSFGTGG